ncbi:hypothetical protein DCAR_0418012 [Daucus carota subsp. sativus]|uniref:NAC domain-containing protein n=1 Tax=Daucus carota subsp. sativus TaxID=79200 RepID=A0A165Z387_DAUCS|nr:PREDICTED: NAC transcription factor 25 [Daucus carota subsp. sativus]WOG98668.1 hypothetical protein DCAR_0418012 [Daucus carota subsp. sativus]
MESTDSSTASRKQQPQLPPGFRFHPTDEELVVHYLKNKVDAAPLPAAIIAEIDLYKFDPWELPAKACFGEQEWYFFTPRDRKYPNGARPNRAATSGYWKATGTDKPVLSGTGSQKVGVKKALVFYGGKPPKGIKTNWVMHEYRLIPDDRNKYKPAADHSDILANKKGSSRLDDWVLCRIYKKKMNPQRPILDHESCESLNELMLPSFGQLQSPNKLPSLGLKASTTSNTYGSFLENDQTMFEGMVPDHNTHIQNSPMNNSLSSFPSSAANLLSLKPSFLGSNLYWNSQEGMTNTDGGGTNCSSSSGKRFVTERGDHENVSFPSLLIQFPQNSQASMQQASTLGGNIGDQQGVVRQHEPQSMMNWYSQI